MNSKAKEYTIKSIIVLISAALLSFGVIFFVAATWGQDPLSTFEIGVENVTGIKMGTVDLIIEIVVLVLALFVDRKLIHIGTVIYAFLFGPMMNFWFATVSPLLPAANDIPMKIFYVAIGTVIMSFALAFYLPINMGYQCSDILAFMLGNLVHKGYGVGMTIEGVIEFTLGVLMGATWGIGTLVATFTLGPLTEIFMKVTTPIVTKIAGMTPENQTAESEASV